MTILSLVTHTNWLERLVGREGQVLAKNVDFVVQEDARTVAENLIPKSWGTNIEAQMGRDLLVLSKKPVFGPFRQTLLEGEIVDPARLQEVIRSGEKVDVMAFAKRVLTSEHLPNALEYIKNAVKFAG